MDIGAVPRGAALLRWIGAKGVSLRLTAKPRSRTVRRTLISLGAKLRRAVSATVARILILLANSGEQAEVIWRRSFLVVTGTPLVVTGTANSGENPTLTTVGRVSAVWTPFGLRYRAMNPRYDRARCPGAHGAHLIDFERSNSGQGKSAPPWRANGRGMRAGPYAKVR
jgi:hypothetical protein